MRALCGLLLAGLSALGAAAPASHPDPTFFDRVELEVARRTGEFRWRHVEHYSLVADVPPGDLRRSLRGVSYRADGEAFVLGVGDAVEYHGGSILGLLKGQWRPEGRAASWDDRFPFGPNDAALALEAIYQGHKRQLSLPEPGSLPRMVFFAAEPGTERVERDAYAMLRLLVAREHDFAATWESHLGQTLSVDSLLRALWRDYRGASTSEDDGTDHSRLHRVEILLAFAARGGDVDPSEVRDRFSSVELARGPEADSEQLGHDAESLGLLATTPEVAWTPAQRARAEAWLAALPERFGDLGLADARHLAHLARGIRMLRASGFAGVASPGTHARPSRQALARRDP